MKKIVMRLKFEHKSNQVLPFRKFLARIIAYFLFSMSLICISLVIGTVGYYHFAKLSLLDSFYNASMILTGMGPVSEMNNPAAKIFSSLYALFSGILFLSTVAITFAPIAHLILHIFHIKGNGD